MEMKTGIFYGSTTGTTAEIAGRIAAALGVSAGDVHDVAETEIAAVAGYGRLLLGSSTWGDGELQDDWYDFAGRLGREDLSGKTVALFGCGDSEAYGDTFCDALGILYDDLTATGCRFVGACDASDYTFGSSSACRDGKFVGLALDENNESDRTDDRIARWVETLQEEAL